MSNRSMAWENPWWVVSFSPIPPVVTNWFPSRTTAQYTLQHNRHVHLFPRIVNLSLSVVVQKDS
jgi:hypothetical protein